MEYMTWLEASEKLNVKLGREFDAYAEKIQKQKKNIATSSRMIAKAADVKDAFFSFLREDDLSKEKLLKLISIDNLLEKLCVWYTSHSSRNSAEDIFDAANTVLDKYIPKAIPPEALAWESAKERLLKCVNDRTGSLSDECLSRSNLEYEDKLCYGQSLCILMELSHYLLEKATPQSLPQQFIDDLLDNEDPAFIMEERVNGYLTDHRQEVLSSAFTEPEEDWDDLDY